MRDASSFSVLWSNGRWSRGTSSPRPARITWMCGKRWTKGRQDRPRDGSCGAHNLWGLLSRVGGMRQRAQESHGHVWGETDRLGILHVKSGSWPDLVKQGCVEVSRPFPFHQRARKTATLLGGSFSISLIEVPTLSTSPKAAKSRMGSSSFLVMRGGELAEAPSSWSGVEG